MLYLKSTAVGVVVTGVLMLLLMYVRMQILHATSMAATGGWALRITALGFFLAATGTTYLLSH
jgi:hypothetical protein